MSLERKFEFLKRVKMPTQKQFNKRKRQRRLSEWPSTHASWLAPTPTPTLKTRNEVKCFSPLRVVRVCAR